MAFYLDSDYGLRAASPSRHQSYDLQPDYDVNPTIFSDPGPMPIRTKGPVGAGGATPRPSSRVGRLHASRAALSASQQSLLASGPSPEGLRAPEGDLAVPQHSLHASARDGGLKYRLMGVGHDGGFLTSPLIVGPPRHESLAGVRTPRPEIALDSPLLETAGDSIPVNPLRRSFRPRSTSLSSEMAPSLSLGTTASSVDFTSGAMSTSTSMSANHSRDGKGFESDEAPLGHAELSGLGMGRSGIPVLDEHTLNLFGPNAFSEMPRDGAPDIDIDSFIDLDGPDKSSYRSPAEESVDVRLTQSGRLVFSDQASHGRSQQRPPSDQRGEQHDRRPVKAMPTRSLNKAKSCSALSPSAQEWAAANSPYHDQPMTPISAQTSPYDSSFATSQGATATRAPAPATGPSGNLLSFADLYHYGLAQEAALATSIRQSPLHEMPTDSERIGLGMSGRRRSHRRAHSSYGSESAHGYPVQPGFHTESQLEAALRYGTPEELDALGPYGTPSANSSFSTTSRRSLSTSRGYTRPRMPSQPYAQAPMAQDYPMPIDERTIDSLSARQHPQRAMRQPTAPSVYGSSSRNFSYPTRYANAPPMPVYDDATHCPIPPQPAPPPPPSAHGPGHRLPRTPPHFEVQWAYPPPQIPLPPVPTTPRRSRPNPHARCMTGPAGSMADYPIYKSEPYFDEGLMDEYERHFVPREPLQPLPLPVPPASAKRSRDQEDDIGQVASPAASDVDEQRPKRLRSVASAPCLPSRRLKPGPKPKHTKSPEQEHQSVFNATLSPPIPQIHRGASPYSSPLLSGGDDEFQPLDANGEIATTSTVTYVPGPPALPGQPRSSVPREVIQSLYSHIPTHTTATGVKVSKRYVCLIEGCERSFPRKSAIESHIQTHLEDKPFICPHDDW